MESKKTDIEKVEEWDTLEPLIYKRGTSIAIFARLGGKLFRIAPYESKPTFFIVSASAIERMTAMDLYAVLDSYNRDDKEFEQYLEKLPELFAKFTKDTANSELDFNPVLYEKCCYMITRTPTFKALMKTKAKAARQKKEEKKPVPEVTPAPMASVPDERLRESDPRYWQVRAERIKADKERWATQPVVDLLTPKRKKSDLRMAVIKPLTSESATPTQPEQTDTKPIDAAETVKESSHNTSAAETVLETVSAEPASETTAPSPTMAPVTRRRPIVRVIDLRSSTRKKSSLRLAEIKPKVVAEAPKAVVTDKVIPLPPKPPVLGTFKAPEKPVEVPVVVESAAEKAQKNMRALLQKENIVVTDTDLSLPAGKEEYQSDRKILSYYGAADKRLNFEYFYLICKMKRAIQLGIRDIKNTRCEDFEFAPRLFNNQEIIFKIGDECVHLVVNNEVKSGYIINVRSKRQYKLSTAEAKSLFKAINFRMPKGGREAPVDDYPTVEQVLECSHLRSMLRLQPNTDIVPVICHGAIILNRSGKIYHKIKTGEHPTFTTYKEGVVSPMTKSQFNLFYTKLRQFNTFANLETSGAIRLKSQFDEYRFSSNDDTVVTETPIVLKEEPEPIIVLPEIEEPVSAQTVSDEQVITIIENEQPLPVIVDIKEPVVEEQEAEVETAVASTAESVIQPQTDNRASVNDKQEKSEQNPAVIHVVRSFPKIVADAIPEAVSFYGPHLTRANYKIEQDLQRLRLQYKEQNPEIDIPSINPMIGSDNTLYYEVNGTLYVLSLDKNNPFFAKYSENKKGYHLSAQDLKTVFESIFAKKYQAAVYMRHFEGGRKDLKTPHRARVAVPSIAQVLEMALYENRLKNETELSDIQPTVCTGNIVIAKYGNVWYKMAPNEKHASACENGEMRRMTTAEIQKVNVALKKLYTVPYLKKRGICIAPALYKDGVEPQQFIDNARTKTKTETEFFVDAFEWDMQSTNNIETPEIVREVSISSNAVHTEAVDTQQAQVPRTQMLVSDVAFPEMATPEISVLQSVADNERLSNNDLPLAMLLLEQRGEADVPTALYDNNCIYARKNKICYKIKLSAPITFEAIENKIVRPMKKGELIAILADLNQSDNVEQVTLINMLILNAVYDSAVQQQLAQSHAIENPTVEPRAKAPKTAGRKKLTTHRGLPRPKGRQHTNGED